MKTDRIIGKMNIRRQGMQQEVSLIALYLPQFHEVEENSLWWGEGFTDWVSVKNAKPYFPGHKQPRIPYKSEYYNLLEKRVMERQVKMAQKAGITGFCFYHYWFNGRKILEKPIENYLNWTDLSEKFCLSWANEPWIRTWSNVDGNDWNPLGDQLNVKNGHSVLIEQEYGKQEQWKEHFDYLLPFFRDNRYIKIDGKPLFVIYRPDIIPCLNHMVRYWRRLARECGFKGLYVLVTNPLAEYENIADGILLYEPGYTIHHELQKKQMTSTEVPQRIKYSEIWRKILLRRKKARQPIFLGAFTGYDDSPRRGKDSIVVIGSTPEKFALCLRLLLQKIRGKRYGKYIFLMAWNEWGEGAYLEPDEENGYAYLKACRWALRGGMSDGKTVGKC